MVNIRSTVSDKSTDSEQSKTTGRETRQSGEEASIGRVLQALSNRRRRYVLYVLQKQSVAPVEAVAEQITDWEESTPDGVGSIETSDVLTDLYHCHLPKLRNDRLISYDRAGGLVGYNCSATTEQFLTLTRQIDRPGENVG